jgi:hypothetical protein
MTSWPLVLLILILIFLALVGIDPDVTKMLRDMTGWLARGTPNSVLARLSSAMMRAIEGEEPFVTKTEYIIFAVVIALVVAFLAASFYLALY